MYIYTYVYIYTSILCIHMYAHIGQHMRDYRTSAISQQEADNSEGQGGSRGRGVMDDKRLGEILGYQMIPEFIPYQDIIGYKVVILDILSNDTWKWVIK